MGQILAQDPSKHEADLYLDLIALAGASDPSQVGERVARRGRRVIGWVNGFSWCHGCLSKCDRGRPD